MHFAINSLGKVTDLKTQNYWLWTTQHQEDAVRAVPPAYNRERLWQHKTCQVQNESSTTALHSLALYLPEQKGPMAWLRGALSPLAVVSMALNQVIAQSEEQPSHLLFHALLFSLGLHLWRLRISLGGLQLLSLHQMYLSEGEKIYQLTDRLLLHNMGLC